MPPVWNADVSPARSETRPPSPELPEPTTMLMGPPSPLRARPVAIVSWPVMPSKVVSELNNRLPETPAELALAVRRVMKPEEDESLCPVTNDTAPPCALASVVRPATTRTRRPSRSSCRPRAH